MTKIRCIIVDDEPIAQRILRRYLADLSECELIAVCDHAMAARDVLLQQQIDLMFLDIEMPRLKGLDFLRTLAKPPAVILTTAHREYALEGYELAVVDYLLKPISFARFVTAIHRYQQRYQVAVAPLSQQAPAPNILYVKSERKTLKLKEEDILYIEGMNNYIILHVAQQSHIVYTSLTAMLDTLSEGFLRIHKSFVVNRQHIVSYNKESVSVGSKALPIGKAYKEVVAHF